MKGLGSRAQEPDTILRAMRSHKRILSTGETPLDLCLDHVGKLCEDWIARDTL